jgi:hypothetical protein
MGNSTLSKEQLITKAIDNQDIDSLQTLIQDLTNEEMKIMCKSLVPANENQCTILHYVTWQGIKSRFN